MYGCGQSGIIGSPLVSCDEVPLSEIELRFQQDPHVSFAVKAVSALTAAFRWVLRKLGQRVMTAALRI